MYNKSLTNNQTSNITNTILTNNIDINNKLSNENTIDTKKNSEIKEHLDINITNKKNKYVKIDLNDVINDKCFIDTRFHKDYIDVINAFNDWDGLSPHNKQLFNINNIPIVTNKNVDNATINKVGKLLKDFVKTLNNNIKKSSSSYNAIEINGWNKLYYQQEYEDGFKKVQRSLGLPEDLYNSSVKGTRIYLYQYFNITIYKNDYEQKIVVNVVLSRKMTKDLMLLKLSFIENFRMPGNIIIENIDIIGFMTIKKVSLEYAGVNNFYNFDNLEDNNIIDQHNILDELAYKNAIRNQLMQEQIDNLDENDKLTHNNINPYQYQSYKNTRTIQQDMLADKIFE